MQERLGIGKGKVVSLEEGLLRDDEVTCVKPVVRGTGSCKQLIQFVKFLLYLELLLFVGWACYTIWQTYRIESMEVKVTDNIRDTESRDLLGQRLPYERTTVIPADFLTRMEAYLHNENAPSKMTRDDVEDASGGNDKINVFAKAAKNDATSHANETPQSITEESSPSSSSSSSSEHVEASPSIRIDVPSSLEKKLERMLGGSESEESDSDSSKSLENTAKSAIPLLSLSYVEDQPWLSASDGQSISWESTEKPSEVNDYEKSVFESEQIDSDEEAALTNYILLSLMLRSALHDTQASEAFVEDTDVQFPDFALNDYRDEIWTNTERTSDTSRSVMDRDIFGTHVDTKERTARGISTDWNESNDDNSTGERVSQVIGRDPTEDQLDDKSAEKDLFLWYEKIYGKIAAENLKRSGDLPEPIKQEIHMTAGYYGKPSIPDNGGFVQGFDGRFVPQLFQEQAANSNVLGRMEHETDNRVSSKEASLNTLIDTREAASFLDDYIREEESLLAREIATVPANKRQSLKNDLNNFFSKMEMLTTHIDKLHERYLYLNHLNDDYVSVEFPSD